MKILEICPYSAGICGVWTRVLAESKEFIRLGNKVIVFSSNIIKGTDEKAVYDEEIEGIKIKRFKSNQDFFDKILSKNVIYFDFQKELKDLINKKQVDIVITHLLHPHSFKTLKVCLKNKVPCYLVTHAPFNVKRKFPLNLATSFYNFVKVKPLINRFSKIISITKWEYPYLKELGVNESKIVYIPNGLPEEFFTEKITLPIEGKDILFLGRIAPVKNLETLIFAAKIISDMNFAIVGSFEKDYLDRLTNLIKKNNLNNVKILPPVYDIKQKIKLIDSYKIFVLPSSREAMPQVLLEAMARGKIVISSSTDGGKEIIKNNQNGLLFEINDDKSLKELILKNINGNQELQKQAIKESKKFSWKRLIKAYLFMFKNDKHYNNLL